MFCFKISKFFWEKKNSMKFHQNKLTFFENKKKIKQNKIKTNFLIGLVSLFLMAYQPSWII